jgi:hypothetical protein
LQVNGCPWIAGYHHCGGGERLASQEEILNLGLHRLPKLALLGSLLLIAPAAGRAQELYTYSLGLLGTVGGSTDAEPGNSLTNTGYQVNALLVTEPRTLVGIRAGKLALDEDGLFNTLSDAELSYATIGGEYRARQTYFESGLFVGLGGYRLEGTTAGRSSSKSSWGLSAGVTSEFFVTRRIGVLLELSGHYVDLDDVQFFIMGHGGVAIHF